MRTMRRRLPMTLSFAALVFGLACVLHLSGCGGGTPETRATTAQRLSAHQPTRASPDSLRNMRAVHMGGNWGNNWDGIKSETNIHAYLDYLIARNVEWVGVSVAMFVNGNVDPVLQLQFRPAGTTQWEKIYTFDDDDLRRFLTLAHQRGLRLYLTLAIERHPVAGAADPACNTDAYVPERWLLGRSLHNMDSFNLNCIPAGNWWWDPAHPQHATKLAQFWSSYTAIATKYAAMAEATGVEIFSLGTETDGIFRTRTMTSWPDNYLGELNAMVAAVRAVYSGWITYDQHDPVTINTSFFDSQQYLFGDLGLDFVGISAYYSLAVTARLQTPTELGHEWRRVFRDYILPLQRRNPGRPIIFTEFGYTDDVRTVIMPSYGDGEGAEQIGPGGNQEGMQQQSAALSAFFTVNAELGQPVRGAFLWNNWMLNDTALLCGITGFHLYCKSAEAVVTAAYGEFAKADADRVFTWAEATWPQLFPGHEASFEIAGYYARYYAPTGNYVGYKGGTMYVHNGRDWFEQNVGSLSSLRAQAAIAGY